jgi:hypothetical protein
VGVEAVEPRISLSVFTLQQPGVVSQVEDPNERWGRVVGQIEDLNRRWGHVVAAFNP